MHGANVTVLRAHYKGRLVLSGDASGCWVLHQLVPVADLASLPAPAPARPPTRAPSPHAPARPSRQRCAAPSP